MAIITSNENLIEAFKNGGGDQYIYELTTNYMTQGKSSLALECSIQAILRYDSETASPHAVHALRGVFQYKLDFSTNAIDHSQTPNAKFLLELMNSDEKVHEYLTSEDYFSGNLYTPDIFELVKNLQELGASDDLSACFN